MEITEVKDPPWLGTRALVSEQRLDARVISSSECRTAIVDEFLESGARDKRRCAERRPEQHARPVRSVFESERGWGQRIDDVEAVGLHRRWKQDECVAVATDSEFARRLVHLVRCDLLVTAVT